MSNNNVPTGPGWYYRDELEPYNRVVWVSFVTNGGLVSYVSTLGNVYDEENTKWRGPVPMPGEFSEMCRQWLLKITTPDVEAAP